MDGTTHRVRVIGCVWMVWEGESTLSKKDGKVHFGRVIGCV